MKKYLSSIMLLFLMLFNFSGSIVAANTFDTMSMDQFLEEQIEDGLIPGLSIVITKDGENIYEKSFGRAYKDEGGFTTNTKMYIASVAKPITATAIMQLVEAGKIDIKKPVKEYLPYFQLKDEKETKAITVEHLLSHTSGIPTIEGLNEKVDANKSVEKYINDRKDLLLTAQVGEKFQYSNTNYAILGAIIEAVTNQSYNDYIKEHIFTPLNMNNSYASSSDEALENIAMGHQPVFGFQRPKKTQYVKPHVSAGYVISTAEDLSHFVTAYLNKGEYNGYKLLSSFSIEEMHTPRSTMNYGLGWYSGEISGKKVIYHYGDQNSYRSTVALIPSDNIGISIVTNTNHALTIAPFKSTLHGVVSIPQGEQPNEGWLNTKNLYLIINLVLLSFLSLLLFKVITFKKWLMKTKVKKQIWPLSLSVLGVIIASLICFGFYKIAAAPWSSMFVYAGDITGSILFLVIGFVILGLLKIGVCIARVINCKKTLDHLPL